MKKILVLLLALGLAAACRKDSYRTTTPLTEADSLSLATVRAWPGLVPGTRQTAGKTAPFQLGQLTIPWERAHSFPAKNRNYWLVPLAGQPTFGKAAQGYRRLAFMRDSSGRIYARILEIVPDGLYWQRKGRVENRDFTGRIFIYDESYHLLGGQVYSGGRLFGKIRPDGASGGKQQVINYLEFTECGWSQSTYFDSEGEFTVYDEYDCTTLLYMDGGGGGYGGGDLGFTGGSGDYVGTGGQDNSDLQQSPPPQRTVLPGGNQPAIDPKAYMKCFGAIADAGATMQVTIYVVEPEPGTSFNVGVNAVGHTAIGLTKTGTGGTITQTVGFYPTSSFSALNGPSKMVDNSQLSYNVSITYNVNAVQFNNIASYIANPPSVYTLGNYNCTTFAYYAMRAGNITLPDPYSIIGLDYTGTGFEKAMTPAGLGVSIENMNGQPGVNHNGGTITTSHGPCN